MVRRSDAVSWRWFGHARCHCVHEATITVQSKASLIATFPTGQCWIGMEQTDAKRVVLRWLRVDHSLVRDCLLA